jgi:hypothetical protein
MPWSRLNELAPIAGSAAANSGRAKVDVDIGGFVGQIEEFLPDSDESFFQRRQLASRNGLKLLREMALSDNC